MCLFPARNLKLQSVRLRHFKVTFRLLARSSSSSYSSPKQSPSSVPDVCCFASCSGHAPSAMGERSTVWSGRNKENIAFNFFPCCSLLSQRGHPRFHTRSHDRLSQQSAGLRGQKARLLTDSFLFLSLSRIAYGSELVILHFRKNTK